MATDLSILDPITQSPLTVPFALAASVFSVFAFLNRQLSDDAKAGLTLWLEGEYESTWSAQFCAAFDAFFGKEHLHWRCFMRSSLASIIAVLVLYWLFNNALDLHEDRQNDTLELTHLLLLGAVINIVPDYLSLYETRWLLRQMHRVTSVLGQLVVLAVDAIVSAAIIGAAIFFARWVLDLPTLTLIEMLALFSVYAIFFYSTFLTSAWAWLYCLSTWLMRLFARTPLKSILDINNAPMTRIGLVGAVVVFIGTLSVSPLFTTLKSEEGSTITVFDQWLCDQVDAKVCGHIVRLTSEEQRTLELLTKACEGGTLDYCLQAAFKHYEGDKKKAAGLFQRACDDKAAIACTYLGFLYESGSGVERNAAKAAELYRYGCKNGYVQACDSIRPSPGDVQVPLEDIEV